MMLAHTLASCSSPSPGMEHTWSFPNFPHAHRNAAKDAGELQAASGEPGTHRAVQQVGAHFVWVASGMPWSAQVLTLASATLLHAHFKRDACIPWSLQSGAPECCSQRQNHKHHAAWVLHGRMQLGLRMTSRGRSYMAGAFAPLNCTCFNHFCPLLPPDPRFRTLSCKCRMI